MLQRVLKSIIFFECNQKHLADFFNENLSEKYSSFQINDKEYMTKKINSLYEITDYYNHNIVALPKVENQVTLNLRQLLKS